MESSSDFESELRNSLDRSERGGGFSGDANEFVVGNFAAAAKPLPLGFIKNSNLVRIGQTGGQLTI